MVGFPKSVANWNDSCHTAMEPDNSIIQIIKIDSKAF